VIERIHLEHFKCFRRLELENLGRLTVFVGPNGSGKTSILEAMDYLANYLFKHDYSPSDLFKKNANAKEALIEIGGAFIDQQRETIELNMFRAEDGFRVSTSSSIESENARPGCLTEETREFLDSFTLLGFDIDTLAAPSYSEEETPRVHPDGSGLASVIRELQAREPARFEELLERLQHVVPAVEHVRTKRAWAYDEEVDYEKTGKPKREEHVTRRPVMGEELLFDMAGAEGIPASEASEGTLIALGLLTVVMSEERPRLLLLDDIDRALHPKALGDLVEVLEGLLEQYGDLQILATSHSPYLLDHLEPEQIWLTALDDSGDAHCDRLDHHPEFEEWRDVMDPGEFWSYTGEDWVVEVDNHDG
jgi:predicted ATPase